MVLQHKVVFHFYIYLFLLDQGPPIVPMLDFMRPSLCFTLYKRVYSRLAFRSSLMTNRDVHCKRKYNRPALRTSFTLAEECRKHKVTKCVFNGATKDAHFIKNDAHNQKLCNLLPPKNWVEPRRYSLPNYEGDKWTLFAVEGPHFKTLGPKLASIWEYWIHHRVYGIILK